MACTNKIHKHEDYRTNVFMFVFFAFYVAISVFLFSVAIDYLAGKAQPSTEKYTSYYPTSYGTTK